MLASMASVGALLLAMNALVMPLASGSWSKDTTSSHTIAKGGRGRDRGQVLSFLWRRPRGLPPVLVQSIWDPQGHLLACALRDEPAHTNWYLEAYKQQQALNFSGTELQHYLDTLEVQNDTCWGAEYTGEDLDLGVRRTLALEEQEAQETNRIQRGLTMPGTLWCGAGNIASNFSHLGTFKGPDMCCRDHDHCDIQISGLKYNYGVFNFRPHTISHCDCDTRFRNCLMSLSDSIADFIGKTYFNVMFVPCFELKEGNACVEWNWMYMCTNYSQMPVAHLVDPSPYVPIGLPTPTLQPGTQSSQDRKRSQKKWKQLRHAHPNGAGQRRRLGR
uniref:phospholipase A2 n=1 Tax=Abronia graminea TaxID=278977 RepID=K4I293_ABRGR